MKIYIWWLYVTQQNFCYLLLCDPRKLSTPLLQGYSLTKTATIDAGTAKPQHSVSDRADGEPLPVFVINYCSNA